MERVCEFILCCLDEAQGALIGARTTYPQALQLATQRRPARAASTAAHAAWQERFLQRWRGRGAPTTNDELVAATTTCLWAARRLIGCLLAIQGESHDSRFAAPYRDDFHFYHRGTGYGNTRTLWQMPLAQTAEPLCP